MTLLSILNNELMQDIALAGGVLGVLYVWGQWRKGVSRRGFAETNLSPGEQARLFQHHQQMSGNEVTSMQTLPDGFDATIKESDGTESAISVRKATPEDL